MKINKLKYALCALFCTAAVSCDLTEKPTSFYEMDSYFTSYDKAKMSVTGIYDCFAEVESYGQWAMPFASSDDMYMVRGTGTGDGTRRDISHYAVNANNSWIASIWKYLYRGLDRANTAITGIEGMEGYNESKELQELVAEARFLRGFIGFELIRYWGDVPFKTEKTETFEQASQPRKDREEIYEQVIKDLDFAKANLKPGAGLSPETPCQAAARTLLMRVYLQRAGYSLDRTTKTLKRPDEATRKTYFDAVITEWKAIEEEGYHKLYEQGYEQLFKNFSQLVLDNQESLWEIAFEPNNGQKENAGQYATWMGPLTDAPSGKNAQEHYGRSNAFFTVLPYWKEFFEDNDVRNDVSIVDYVQRWDKKKDDHVKLTVCKEVSTDMQRYPGKWRREWMAPGFVDPNNTGVNFCPIRYADAVLMAAEAYYETGNSTEAWKQLNRIRTRAGVGELSATKAHPNVYKLDFIEGNDAFRTALYWERAFELAFEGVRKFDLIRWGILKESLVAAQTYSENWTDGEKYFKDVKSDGTPVENSTATWNPKEWTPKNYVAGTNFVTGKHELFPIPLAEMQQNAKLEGKNNPGY